MPGKSGGSGSRRRDLRQSRLQGGFLSMVERSLEHRAAFAFEPVKNLVCRDLAHQYEERRGSGLNGGSGLPQPFVVNADIGQISAERAGPSAEATPTQDHQKTQANK